MTTPSETRLFAEPCFFKKSALDLKRLFGATHQKQAKNGHFCDFEKSECGIMEPSSRWSARQLFDKVERPND